MECKYLNLLVLLLLLALPQVMAQGVTPASSMNEPRSEHAATLLNNGMVLVTGGYSDTAELFDPKTGSWRYTLNHMNATRLGAAAVKLADGKVLIIGGHPTYTGVGYLTAEVFDPANETFTPTGPLNAPRNSQHPTFFF